MTTSISPMAPAPAGPKLPLLCYVIGIALPSYMLLAITALVFIHLNTISWMSRNDLLRSHVMCGGFGMLGAAMAAIRKYYRVLITDTTNRNLGKDMPRAVWDFAWSYYYFTRPFLGGILGAMTFTLTFISVQILTKASDLQLAKHGCYLLYAVAFISGFSVSHVLDRLNNVARQAFKAKSSNPE